MNARRRILIAWLLPLLMAGCSLLPQGQEDAAAKPRQVQNLPAVEPLLFYTERLAEQLFYQLPPLDVGAITVATFAEAQALRPDSSRKDSMNLALQLQDSMQTVAAQLGYKVSELRLSTSAVIASDHETVLSRDLSVMTAAKGTRYVITGTMTESDFDMMVNAKLVDLSNQQVMAAASTVIPIRSFSSNEQLQMRHNKLYRQSE